MVAGIILLVLAGVLLIVVILLRTKIYIATQIITAGAEFVDNNRMVVFFPFIMFILLVITFLFFFAVGFLLEANAAMSDAGPKCPRPLRRGSK